MNPNSSANGTEGSSTEKLAEVALCSPLALALKRKMPPRGPFTPRKKRRNWTMSPLNLATPSTISAVALPMSVYKGPGPSSV